MEQKVQDILANLPGKEMMAQWPLKAVNAIEVLKNCVLNDQFEKDVVCDSDRAGQEGC